MQLETINNVADERGKRGTKNVQLFQIIVVSNFGLNSNDEELTEGRSG